MCVVVDVFCLCVFVCGLSLCIECHLFMLVLVVGCYVYLVGACSLSFVTSCCCVLLGVVVPYHGGRVLSMLLYLMCCSGGLFFVVEMLLLLLRFVVVVVRCSLLFFAIRCLLRFVLLFGVCLLFVDMFRRL